MGESPTKTLQEIEAQVLMLARGIGAAGYDLPSYGTSRDFAYPHVEVGGGLYHYVMVERGQEQSRRSSPRYDDLLYWIFSDVTHNLAFSYELKHRVRHQDARRIAFARQIELMRRISSTMGDRLEADIAEILARAPYDDSRAQRLDGLREEDS